MFLWFSQWIITHFPEKLCSVLSMFKLKITWGGMDIWVNEGSKTIYKVSGTSSAGRVESNAQCLQTNSSPNDNHQPVHTGNVRDQTFTLDVIEKHSLLCKCLYKYIFIYLSPFQAIKAHKKKQPVPFQQEKLWSRSLRWKTPKQGLLWHFSEGLYLAHKTILKITSAFYLQGGVPFSGHPSLCYSLCEVNWNHFYIITYCFKKGILHPEDQLFQKNIHEWVKKVSCRLWIQPQCAVVSK